MPFTGGSGDKVVDTALDDLSDLMDLCDDLAERNKSVSAEEFAASIKTSALSMHDWIKQNEVATDKQLDTIKNWTTGVRKWLR